MSLDRERPSPKHRQCIGITRPLRRCKRQSGAHRYCRVHERQPLQLAFVFAFTVVAGFASIYSAVSTALPSESRSISMPLKAMTPTSATLTGRIDTGTPPTRAWFELSTDRNTLASGHGSSFPQVAGSPFTREGIFPVVQQLSGLTPNTTYFYRVVVSNDYGEYVPLNIQTFTTPALANAGTH